MTLSSAHLNRVEALRKLGRGAEADAAEAGWEEVRAAAARRRAAGNFFCTSCGAENSAGATYCSGCGRAVTALHRNAPRAAQAARDLYPPVMDEDVVGTGRYVLSFVLAGFVGLAIQYGLRKKGWMATWINAVIVVMIVILFAAAG